MGYQGVRPDKNRLAHNCRAQHDDTSTNIAIVGAPDLAPLADVERLSGKFLEGRMPPKGVYLGRVKLRRQSGVPLPGPNELDLKPLLGKQAFTLFTTPGPGVYLPYIYPMPFAIVLPNNLPDLAAAFYCIDVKLPDRLYGLGG